MCVLQGPIEGPTRILYLLVVDENAHTRGPTSILYVLVVDENAHTRGPTRILYVLVVDENAHAHGPTRILYVLVVNENTHARGSTRILYMLVVDENRYELYLQKGRQLTVEKTDVPCYYRASFAHYSFPVWRRYSNIFTKKFLVRRQRTVLNHMAFPHDIIRQTPFLSHAGCYV
jgi:hypothetical protein